MVEEKLERHVLKTIAGFANGKGGTLLIGIDADRKVVGLQNDYASLKGDSDLFERHLRQSLQTQVGKAVTVLKVRISFHEISGKEVCRVDVDASSEPLFFKAGNIEEFFVRSGNATIRMEGEQLVKYIRERFVK
jgi:predicted HTH transcriptional regulator